MTLMSSGSESTEFDPDAHGSDEDDALYKELECPQLAKRELKLSEMEQLGGVPLRAWWRASDGGGSIFMGVQAGVRNEDVIAIIFSFVADPRTPMLTIPRVSPFFSFLFRGRLERKRAVRKTEGRVYP